MIHRYNLADLNLPEREAKAPTDLSFTKRQELKEVQNWTTTSNAAFGISHHVDA
jgi:hypothetical protein